MHKHLRSWGRRGAVPVIAAGVSAGLGVRRYLAVREVPQELRATWLLLPAFVPPLTPWAALNRATLGVGRHLMRRESRPVPGVRVERRTLGPGEGGGEVLAYLYTPAQRSSPGAALLWMHGGDHVLGDAAQDHDLCSAIAARLGILVLSVDYRLAPDHPHPAALDDCCTGLRWLHERADSLGVEPGSVAVGGASAGGGLAATLAQRARDEGLPVGFQLLVYPMLDDRTCLRTDHHRRGRVALTPRMLRYGWTSYLGHRPRPEQPGRYAAAARGDLSGLAPAWIGVGSLDLLHDEAVEYARRLAAAGVPCELHVEPGMYHGADVALASTAGSMRRFRERMTDALRAGLARSPAGEESAGTVAEPVRPGC